MVGSRVGIPKRKKQLKKAEKGALTDRQLRFVAEYSVCLNAKEAAIKAGCPESSASATGNKWLKKPAIAKLIGNRVKTVDDKCMLRQEDVTEQLACCLTVQGDDFVDDDGLLLNLKKLPKRAKCAISGITQTVKRYTDSDGVETQETTTKLQIVNKASAIDMAMKHFGLYKPEKREDKVTVTLSWDEFYNRDKEPSNVVDVKAKLLSTTPVKEA